MLNPIFDESKDVVSPLDFIEIMKDKDQIQKKYISCVKETMNNFLTFNKGPYVCDTPGRLKEQVGEETKLLKRGVLCRDIFEKGELKDQIWLMNYIKSQSKYGQQSRITKTLPIKMMVFDEKKVILPLQQNAPDGNGLTLLYIEHQGLALACKSLFDSVWEKAETAKF